MQRTSKRLLLGAKAIKDETLAASQAALTSPPAVEYPNKVSRTLFFGVSKEGGKAEALFREVVFFRKVEGYRSSGEKKTRILSPVHTKEREVSVSFYPSSSFFRSLEQHQNPLLSKHALPIIACFDDPNLYPLWAQRRFIDKAHEIALKEAKKPNADKRRLEEAKAQAIETESRNNLAELEAIEKKLDQLKEAQFRYIRKQCHHGFRSSPLRRTVLSFGLYRPLRSAKLEAIHAKNAQKSLDDLNSIYVQAIKDHQWYFDNLARIKASKEGELSIIDRAKQLEAKQLEFVLADFGQPLNDPVPPEEDDINPALPLDVKYEYELPVDLIEPQEELDFLPFEDPSFYQYDGLKVVAVALLENSHDHSYQIGITFDLAASLKRMFDKEGNFHDKNLDVKRRESGGLDDFRLAVRLVYDENELFDSYCRYQKAYLARYFIF